MSLKSPFLRIPSLTGFILIASLWMYAGTDKNPTVEARRCAKDEDKTGLLGARPKEAWKGLTPPQLVYQFEPERPDPHVRAFVVINTMVDEHGIPVNLCVARGFLPAFDQSAVSAISQWRFKPAKQKGQPVAVRVNIEVEFRPDQ